MKLTARSSILKGFTLIELLVVIAVMGVLATIVLVAVDPGEQFNRAEDGNRKQTVNSLGNAMLQYATTRSTAADPNATENDTFIQTLVDAGELKALVPDGGTTCDSTSTGTQRGYCYDMNSTTDNFTISTVMESKAEDNTSAGVACGTPTDTNVSFFIFDSSTGKTCKVCGVVGTYIPAPGACP
jgi:prepilin-type N-terminal cleavage/methylation domain-containing protein